MNVMFGRINVGGALACFAVVTAALFVIVALAESSAAKSALAESSEIGFASFSPVGKMGGAIIPASCESGLGEGGAAHWLGDTGTPDKPASCGTPVSDPPLPTCAAGETLVFQHPPKTCTNQIDSCTTPSNPDTDFPYPRDETGGANYGCSLGYWSGYSYCWGNTVNGVCPQSLIQGSFDFAEGRISGVHEDALFCYARNVPVCVAQSTSLPDPTVDIYFEPQP